MSDPVTPLNAEQTASAELHSMREGYIVRLLVSLDKEINIASGGESDETISARAARLATMVPATPLEKAQHDYGVLMCNFLNLFQADHGAKAIAGDEARAEQTASTEEASGDITILQSNS